jgi:putrescine importer
MLRGWRYGGWSQWFPMLLSLGGFVTCMLLWFSLGPLAKLAGTGWALLGVLLFIARRRQTVLPAEA